MSPELEGGPGAVRAFARPADGRLLTRRADGRLLARKSGGRLAQARARLAQAWARLAQAWARLARGLALVAVSGAVAVCTLASSARADGPQLCAGYAPCDALGLTDHGYQYASAESWWSMYPGINCTNYAAYVESQVYGVPTPGLLLGDAYQWADSAARAGIPVDDTPSVGAVAVWGPDAPGMTGFGHVAVVEAVGPNASYIDVSQSGMGALADGFDWQRIYRDGSSWEPWPTSFIHFSGPGIPGTLPRAGLRVSGAVLAPAGG